MGSRSGFIRKPLEQAAGQFCQLGPTTRSASRRRLQSELEMAEGLCVPSLLFDSEVSEESDGGRSGPDAGDSALAGATVVLDHSGAGVRAGSHSPRIRSPIRPIGAGAPSSELSRPSRMAVIRKNYESAGVSNQVVELLVGGTRKSTLSAYESAWNGSVNWNVRRNEDPILPAIGRVLEFLTSLAESGKAYRTINVFRSMFSSTIGKIDGVEVGKHPLVVRLMKGIYHRTPPAPKYSSFWNVSSIVDYFQALGPNESLSLADLSQKCAMLLALASLCRISELAGINRRSITVKGSTMRMSLSSPRKSQRGGAPLHVINLNRMVPPGLACPVATLEAYLLASDTLRTANGSEFLFLGLRPPHRSIGASSVSRWLKLTLEKAGIDTEVYTAHSTRGAAASRAANAGLSVESILKAGSWSSESTFTRFYRRQLHPAAETNTLPVES